LLKRPVKWVEDRRESFTATNHERVQDWEVEAAASADGKLLAMRGHFRHDHGAFTPTGLSLPQNATTNLIGPYVLPALALEVSAAARAGGAALPHQHGGGDLAPRRRPPAGHLRDGAPARPHCRRAWPCARRGAAPQPRPAARNALRHQGRHPRRAADDLRQRR